MVGIETLLFKWWTRINKVYNVNVDPKMYRATRDVIIADHQ